MVVDYVVWVVLSLWSLANGNAQQLATPYKLGKAILMTNTSDTQLDAPSPPFVLVISMSAKKPTDFLFASDLN